MVTFNVGAGGSGGLSYAYIFKGNQAYTVDGIGDEITYLSKNQFEITDSRFDNFKDGSGHTWNKYYAKWDGTKLVEYGGLKISQTQLKKATNGGIIHKAITKCVKYPKKFPVE